MANVMMNNMGNPDVNGLMISSSGIMFGNGASNGLYGIRPFFNEKGILSFLLMGPERYLKLEARSEDEQSDDISDDISDEERIEFDESGVSDQVKNTIIKIESKSGGKVVRIPVLVDCPCSDCPCSDEEDGSSDEEDGSSEEEENS